MNRGSTDPIKDVKYVPLEQEERWLLRFAVAYLADALPNVGNRQILTTLLDKLTAE